MISTERTSGRLKIIDSNKELSFSIHPETFEIEKRFQIISEQCLGEASPVVSFQGGAARSLNVRVCFDQDVDSEFNSTQVFSFLRELEKTDSKSKSLSLVEFKLGEFLFKGFVSHYHFQPTRFNKKLEAKQGALSISMIESVEGA